MSKEGPPERTPASVLVTANNLAVDRLTVDVSTALSSAGVRSILLKGPTFARWLYEEPHERPYIDTDLLISERDVETAESVLRDLGFAHGPLDDLRHDKPWHAHSWLHRGVTGTVDLHRTLIGIRRRLEETWEILSAHTESILVLDHELEGLDEAARSLHVALHAAQDGSSDQAQTDLQLALEKADRDTWRTAAELADQLEATDAFSLGLRGIPGGEELADQLGLASRPSIDTYLRSIGAPPEAVGVAWMSSQRGFKRKLAWIWTKTFPPRAFMEAWTPIAQKGLPGLVAGYFLRLGSLIRRAPRAFLAWRRARRNLKSQ